MFGFFAKKLEKAKCFALGLETITDEGVIDIQDLKVGDTVMGKDFEGLGGDVLNKVEETEKISKKGTYYCINGKVLLFENQSVVANDNVTHAKLLKVGDELVGVNNQKIVITSVIRIRGRYHFFRLKVAANHTYFLNGILMHNASRFWVAGTGNWDAAGTTHWAATSGGVAGASVPSSSDDVTFDTLSNAVAYTATITATANCANLTMGAPLTGAVTWAGSAALNIFGNMNLSGGTGGITRTYTGAITFSATATGKTIDPNGITFATGLITFNGVGGEWTLQNALTNTVGITLTNGTFITNGKAVSCTAFGFSASNTIGINISGSTVTLSNNQIAWAATNPNMTVTVNTSSLIVCTGTTATFNGGTYTYNDITLNGTLSSVLGGFIGAFTARNVTVAPSGTSKVFVGACNNFTVTGTLTLTGSDAANRMTFGSGVNFSGNAQAVRTNPARTITAAAVSLTRVDFQDIIGAGAATWSGTSVGNIGNNSNITFTTPVTVYWVGDAGSFNDITHWASSSGGAGSSGTIPLPQDTAVFDTNSFTINAQTVTFNTLNTSGVNFSLINRPVTIAFTSPFSAGAALYQFCGNTVLSANLTWGAHTGNIVFSGNAQSLTTAAVAFNGTVRRSGVGTLTLLDDLIFANTFTILGGTLDLNGKNMSVTTFTAASSDGSGSLPIATLGSGTLTLTGTGQVWQANSSPPNTTINAQTSTIKITNSTNNAITFNGGNFVYNILWFARGASTGSNTFIGNNTFFELKDTGTAAHSMLFTAASTTTISTLTATGSSGNAITINSTTTATHALVKGGNGIISCDWLNIQHSVATPAAGVWFAGANSVNNQGVATAGSGWIFTIPSKNRSFVSSIMG